MHVSYHIFKNHVKAQRSDSDEEALANLSPELQRAAMRDLYSFVSMCHHPRRNTLFLGTTHRLGDILVAFDLQSRTFRSCGYQDSGLCAHGDVKIHKGLWLDEGQDALYFGLATLLPFTEQLNNRGGGKLVRYDIASGGFTDLGTPVPGQYLQGTLYDGRRGMMYGFTNCGAFAAYDLRQRRTLRYSVMESCPHNGCLDPEGRPWGLCGVDSHRLFRYHPDRDVYEFPGTPLPNAMAAANIMYRGAGPVDGFIDGGDGNLYIGTALGELYRLDWRTGAWTYLGKPFPDRRLPGLALGGDGWLYLCGGSSHASMLARYHLQRGTMEQFGAIEHPDGTFLHYVHEITVIDGVVYAVETDNPGRSGFLWVCDPRQA